MKYIKFIFKNYRGISEVEIDIPKNKPICLLGLNESGKTTILKAIHTIGQLCQGKELENGERLAIRPKGTDFTGDVIFKTELQIEPSDTVKEIVSEDKIIITFTYSFENHQYTTNTVNINTIRSKVLTDHKDMLNKFIKEQSFQNIVYYDDFMFDVPSAIDPQKEEHFFWKNALNDIYIYSKHSQDNKRVEGIPEKETEQVFERDITKWVINNPDDKITPATRLQRMGNALNNIITNNWRDIAKEKSTFKEIELKANDTYTKFYISIKTQEDIYKVDERSKGFRWFFTFLIATELRKHREKNTIFLLDEPASNLHCAAQEKIRTVLRDLSKNSTVIYSTHSPYLLEKEGIDTTYLVKNEADNNEYTDNNISCNLVTKDLEEIMSNGPSSINQNNIFQYLKPLLDHISYTEPSLLQELFKDKELMNEIEKSKLDNKKGNLDASIFKKAAEKAGKFTKDLSIQVLYAYLLRLIGL